MAEREETANGHICRHDRYCCRDCIGCVLAYLAAGIPGDKAGKIPWGTKLCQHGAPPCQREGAKVLETPPPSPVAFAAAFHRIGKIKMNTALLAATCLEKQRPAPLSSRTQWHARHCGGGKQDCIQKSPNVILSELLPYMPGKKIIYYGKGKPKTPKKIQWGII